MATGVKPAVTGNNTTAQNDGGKRLVVELNSLSSRDLLWLIDAEELNKTTVVNRALQVYRMVIEAQRNGGGITIDDPAQGGEQRVRVV